MSALGQTWSQVLDIPLTNGEITLDNAALKFVAVEDGWGAGVGGLTIKAADSATIMNEASRRGLQTGDEAFMLCGVRVTLT